MTPVRRILPFLLLLAPWLGACAQTETAPQPGEQAEPQARDPSGETPRPMRVTTIAEGLEHPWSVAILPGGGFLVTERPGRLRRIAPDGTVSAPIARVPDVFAEGQGGLLDVVLAPDFAATRRIYLSYAEPGPDGTAGTAVAHAILEGDALTGVTPIYRQAPKLDGDMHFGSRLAFDRDGHLFVSQGERNRRAMAQDLSVLQGKLVRLQADGDVPADNPFAGRDVARPGIWS